MPAFRPEKRAGQARKCTRWMPWHRPAMKDVASCENPRGVASKLGSGGVRMGKPGGSNPVTPQGEPTQGTETSKYLEEKKSIEIPRVAASETGRAQTRVGRLNRGLWGRVGGESKHSGTVLERTTAEGERPVCEMRVDEPMRTPSRPGHVKPWLNPGGPSSKAKYESVTDSE